MAFRFAATCSFRAFTCFAKESCRWVCTEVCGCGCGCGGERGVCVVHRATATKSQIALAFLHSLHDSVPDQPLRATPTCGWTCEAFRGMQSDWGVKQLLRVCLGVETRAAMQRWLHDVTHRLSPGRQPQAETLWVDPCAMHSSPAPPTGSPDQKPSGEAAGADVHNTAFAAPEKTTNPGPTMFRNVQQRLFRWARLLLASSR